MNRTILGTTSRLTGGRWSASRRTEHGGTAWTAQMTMRQPQDGAEPAESRVMSMRSRYPQNSLGAAAMTESEDAKLTGGTRSLLRRVLGLNVTQPMLAKAATKPVSRVLGTNQAQVA